MHEPCVERIFNNIKNYYKPAKLSVFAKYNRRGGLDNNTIHLFIISFFWNASDQSGN
ncbi:MAG: hypothetical protein V6011_00280 [Candidatus Dasytiphilus stammeri]